MKTKILLSIIIPTKNRQKTLYDLVESLLLFNLNTVEIIIEDNSSYSSEIFFKKIAIKNLYYFYASENRSMVDNCEIAVSKATGEYIAMIGDDDGIDVELAIQLLKNKKYDFYLSPAYLFYWPGISRRLYGKSRFGFVAKYKKVTAVEINPINELEKVLSIGGTDILLLPRLYQGIVKRECLLQIKKKTGKFFNAPMADMASSAALSLYCSVGYMHSEPFIINGASSNSGGGLGAQGKHVGKLESAYGFTSAQLLLWPDKVPFFWSGGTVWSASLYTSLIKLGFTDFARKINYDYIYSHIVCYHLVDYYKIFGCGKLKTIHFVAAAFLFRKRIKSFLGNVLLYSKLSLGYGIKASSISELLRLKSIRPSD